MAASRILSATNGKKISLHTDDNSNQQSSSHAKAQQYNALSTLSVHLGYI
jgi:hypothetical protein